LARAPRGDCESRLSDASDADDRDEPNLGIADEGASRTPTSPRDRRRVLDGRKGQRLSRRPELDPRVLQQDRAPEPLQYLARLEPEFVD
jgi:hypothetical protein